ncbi:MAG: sigma-70 family RNA polymerase sigma factor [Isosphaeraceae bacterium]
MAPPRPPAPPLGETLEAFREYLYRVADRQLGPDLAAKLGASDIVQETFLAAQRGVSGFRGRTEAEWRAWLETILRSRLANARRHYWETRKRGGAGEVSLDAPVPSGESGSPMEPGARGGLLGTDDTVSTPSGKAIRRERERALVLALERLPDHYREVVRWHHEERLTFDQIAGRLKTSPDAARKLWARALLRLREALGSSHDPG